MHQDDVEAAGQLAMLKAIIQQMDSWRLEFAFRQLAGLIAIRADIDRNAGGLSDQQGFIPKAFGAAGAVYALYCVRRTPVPARQHIGMQSFALQQFRQANRQWRFACAPHGEVANADHGPAQALWRRAVKARIPGSDQPTVKQLQWSEQRGHEAGNKPSRAVTARPVAPD